MAVGDPADCCTTLLNDNVVGKIVVAHRGNCMFVEKVKNLVILAPTSKDFDD